MTIVEAMQNKIVPIVFDGGGQREIVEQDTSGFRVSSTAQLMSAVLKLVRDNELRQKMAENAFERSKLFSRETFEANIKEFYQAPIGGILFYIGPPAALRPACCWTRLERKTRGTIKTGR